MEEALFFFDREPLTAALTPRKAFLPLPLDRMLLLCVVVLCIVVISSASSCLPIRSNSFCTGVTWNVSLGQPAEVVDGLAQHDFEAILSKQGRVAATPACLEAWKALQCATKFPRCAKQVTAHLVCRTLCVQFANACNTSESLLLGKGACLDVHKFDAPPCTDYAEPLSADHASWSPDERVLAGGSLSELLHAAAGVPILLALVVAVLHCACCVVQSSCGGGTAVEADATQPTRDALRGLALASGEGMQLVGGS